MLLSSLEGPTANEFQISRVPHFSWNYRNRIAGVASKSMELKFNCAAVWSHDQWPAEKKGSVVRTPPFPSEEVRETEKTGTEVRWGVVQCPSSHPLTFRELDLFVASI